MAWSRLAAPSLGHDVDGPDSEASASTTGVNANAVTRVPLVATRVIRARAGFP